ncbi:TetR/AcrR family transcriptional regulator [Pseudonocardiaceae bacterium YIM PH 21723]|nr:TetR/AcrR family transcriptional regulator [Pseudonocardiaceae bacterium YIM PH 21723]
MTGAPRTASPRRRPRDRRAQVVAAAADLFARRGYHAVGMTEIAEAVGVRASALYRHFAGKQELLRAVFDESFGMINETMPELNTDHLDDTLLRIADYALQHRHFGVLWLREARHLNEENLRALTRAFDRLKADTFIRIQAMRPSLSHTSVGMVTWPVLSVPSSISFHEIELPHEEYRRLLADMLLNLLDARIPEDLQPEPDPEPVGLMPKSRREALLGHAIRLFAKDGFTEVSNEDIGAAVGISGPSIYNHFEAKKDLIVTAGRRALGWLFMDLGHVLRTSSTAEEALRRLVPHYIRYALEHHELLQVVINERLQTGDQGRQLKWEYVAEWTHLMQQVHPRMDLATAQIRVHAAFNVAHDAHRTRWVRHSATPEVLREVFHRILLLPEKA